MIRQKSKRFFQIFYFELKISFFNLNLRCDIRIYGEGLSQNRKNINEFNIKMKDSKNAKKERFSSFCKYVQTLFLFFNFLLLFALISLILNIYPMSEFRSKIESKMLENISANLENLFVNLANKQDIQNITKELSKITTKQEKFYLMLEEQQDYLNESIFYNKNFSVEQPNRLYFNNLFNLNSSENSAFLIKKDNKFVLFEISNGTIQMQFYDEILTYKDNLFLFCNNKKAENICKIYENKASIYWINSENPIYILNNVNEK